jgi:hypothetical protein
MQLKVAGNASLVRSGIGYGASHNPEKRMAIVRTMRSTEGVHLAVNRNSASVTGNAHGQNCTAREHTG